MTNGKASSLAADELAASFVNMTLFDRANTYRKRIDSDLIWVKINLHMLHCTTK
jgi:hypothetical protein